MWLWHELICFDDWGFRITDLTRGRLSPSIMFENEIPSDALSSSREAPLFLRDDFRLAFRFRFSMSDNRIGVLQQMRTRVKKCRGSLLYDENFALTLQK